MRTFEEWWAAQYGKLMPGMITAQNAWHARDGEVADLKARIDALESEIRFERAAALREMAVLVKTIFTKFALRVNEEPHEFEEHVGTRIATIQDAILAIIPSADLSSLDKRDKEMEHRGWVDCLRAVTGSLEGYPNQGGDIGVMKALDKLLAEAMMKEHANHVQFLNDLYATLVDPVAEGSIKEADLMAALLESARWYRQRVYDQDNLLAEARRRGE